MPNRKRNRSSQQQLAASSGGSLKSRLAFTVIELLIVISIIGILAGILLPRWNPSVADNLRSSAQIVMSDLSYARNLAVSNNSTYRYTFDVAQNQYVLEHSGDKASLDILPQTPFNDYGPPTERQTHSLADFFHGASRVTIVGVTARGDGRVATVTNVEFGPLGNTSRSDETIVWLAAGAGSDRRYIAVHVTPMTGLTAIGNVYTQPPADAFAGQLAPLVSPAN